jgi:large repetitive protein
VFGKKRVNPLIKKGIISMHIRKNGWLKFWQMFLCTLLIFGQFGVYYPNIASAAVKDTNSTKPAFSGDGLGTEVSPFIIKTEAQLQEMKDHLDKHFKLGADINLSRAWEPVGTFSLPVISEEDYNDPNFDPNSVQIDYSKGFSGTFDGAGYSITGLMIDEKSTEGINGVFGFFGFTNGATLKDIELKNISVQADSNIAVGGLVGKAMDTSIENTSLSGTVSGKTNVGGLVGTTEDSIITDAITEVSVGGVENIGGIIGSLEKNSKVVYSSASGHVKGDSQIGGLIGLSNASTIKDSLARGAVEGETKVGGLSGVAENVSIIEKSFATGTVKGAETIGGLIGYATGLEKTEDETTPYQTLISQSYATGTVEGESNIGGLVGLVELNTILVNVYSTGSVTNLDLSPNEISVGGLVGKLLSSSINKAYSNGTIISSDISNVGGLVGAAFNSTIGQSYTQQASEQIKTIGEVEDTVVNEVFSRTAEAMKNPLSYEDWVFKTIWVWNPDANSGYPFFRYQQEYKAFDHIEKTETPEEKIARAKENLVISGDLLNITSNLNLRTEQNGVAISWHSSNPNYVTATGKVTRPGAGQQDVRLTLTATLSYQGVTDKKEFLLNVVAMPVRSADLEMRIDQRTRIGNLSHDAENAFLNFGSNSPGFHRSGDWESSLQSGTLIRSNDNGASVSLTLKVSENPELRALAEGGTADVSVGWKELKFNKFGCFLFWCKTRVTDAKFFVDDKPVLEGSARGGNVGPRSKKVRISPNSTIKVTLWVEGKGAGADGMYLKFEDKVRPQLQNYTFIGNGAERTNERILSGSKQELFVKASEYLKLSYNFTEPVRPTTTVKGNALSYDYFLRHPLFVNPAGTGLPAEGQQQFLLNETYNANNLATYNNSISYQYTGKKYHHTGNLPLIPKMNGNTSGEPIDLPMERKLNQVALSDAAGNIADIKGINQSANNSNAFLRGKTVNPFDFENGGYRIIVDAVAPKYTKTGNGITPEILTGVVINENDTIEYTLKLTEEAVVNQAWWDQLDRTYLLFNNGMKAYYVSGAGTDTWKFRATITDAKSLEAPLLKVIAVTHDRKGGPPNTGASETIHQAMEKNIIQDYAGNYLIQPANFSGEHFEACDNGLSSDGKCDKSLVNSKIDWANLSIDNTVPTISYRYENGGANDQTYRKNGKVTIDANDPQIQVPGLDAVNPYSYRPSKGIYRPSNMTGPQSPAVGLVYYVWNQNPDNPFAEYENDHYAAIKRFSLSAKQPGEDLYIGNGIQLSVVNNKTNLISPPAKALLAENSGEWYLHTWTADMSWDSARELMQYEKMKTFIENNPNLYNQWLGEAGDNASEADRIFYANNKALAAVGDYKDLNIWELADFKKNDSNWIYSKGILKLDNQLPTILFSEPENDNTANVTVDVNVKDIHSGFKQVRYQWVAPGTRPEDINWKNVSTHEGVKNEEDLTISTFNDEMITGDGQYDLYISTTDVAGNQLIAKMDGSITVNSIVNMKVDFTPKPDPNYVKSHDIEFTILDGMNPTEVKYAFSSSIARPEEDKFKSAEPKSVSQTEVTEENAPVVNPTDGNDPTEGNGPIKDPSEGNDPVEDPSEGNEPTEGSSTIFHQFKALIKKTINTVINLFSTEEAPAKEPSYYLIPKDETQNGPIYLHIQVKSSDDKYYYFKELYYFNNAGVGVFFSSNAIAFPKESHEVQVTIVRPYSASQTEENKSQETGNEAGSQEEQQHNNENNGAESLDESDEQPAVEPIEKYQWVKAKNQHFAVDETAWKDLPEDGIVRVDYTSLAEEEDIGEFKLFVWVVDQQGNDTKANTAGTFKVFKSIENPAPPADSEFDLIYLTGDDENGYTAIVRINLETEDKRGYDYSLSNDSGTSWTKWRPYTNFASLDVPTNLVEDLQVMVKFRTGAGVVTEKGKEVRLNTATVSKEEPIYGLATFNTTKPVNAVDGAMINITTPLGIKVVPSLANPSEPVRTEGNIFNVKENGYYSFDLTDRANPEKKAILYVVVNNVDGDAPLGAVEYLMTRPTNGNVTVKLMTNENIVVTNNNGRSTYTFTENGQFTFEFKDEAGNVGMATARVDYIFKEAPKVKIVRIYDGHKTIRDEQNNVILSSGVTVAVEKADATSQDFIVNDGKTTKTLLNNGQVSFVVSDQFGNTTIVKETIDNIRTDVPTPESITYTFVDEQGNEIPEDQIVHINGKSYARGKVKVSFIGKTNPINQVFAGVTPIKDDKGKYTNLISDGEGNFVYSKIFSSVGTTTIALTDLLGNVSRVPVKIEGIDNIAPEFHLNMPTIGVEQNKEGFDFAVDLGGFTVTDNLSLSEDIDVAISGFDLTKMGYQRITYTATDQVGNTTVAYQDVYVVNSSGMLIFANDVLVSTEAGQSALFDTNKLTFKISRYNLMDIGGEQLINEKATFDVLYHSGLFREGQMKYIAEKITYEELVNGNFSVTFPEKGWYTLIVRNQERERVYATFFISKIN